MLIPPAPYIPGRDLPIRCHESDYILAPPRPFGGWGYTPSGDWAQGPVPGYVLVFAVDRVGPFTGTTMADDADDSSAGHFADDPVRDDDSYLASHCCCISMMM